MPEGPARPKRVVWDIAVAVGAVASLVVIGVCGAWWALIGIGLFAVSYLLLGRRALITRSPKRSDLPFALGVIASGTICTICSPIFAALQAIICPMLWVGARDRKRAVITNVVLVGAEFLAMPIHYPLIPINFLLYAIIEGLVFGFSMAIGFWITGLEARMQAAQAFGSPPGELSEAPLSPRELEVLQLAAQGLTNQEISDQLFITVATTKTHMQHILAKLDVPNRTVAVAKGKASGWL
jgi:DNA-binding CsgD family transcriptional regulator/fumarate reductase subunit D